MFEIIKELSLRRDRKSELKWQIKRLRTLKAEMKGEGTLPLMHLEQSINSYINGFYIGTILSSSISIELFLLKRLTDKKRMTKALEFGPLIEKCRKNNIIPREEGLIDLIRYMRNSYVHYYNYLYFYSETIKFINEATLSEKEKGYPRLRYLGVHVNPNKIYESYKGLVPDLESAVKPEIKTFMDWRFSQYGVEATLVYPMRALGWKSVNFMDKRQNYKFGSIGFQKLYSGIYDTEIDKFNALEQIIWCIGFLEDIMHQTSDEHAKSIYSNYKSFLYDKEKKRLDTEPNYVKPK